MTVELLRDLRVASPQLRQPSAAVALDPSDGEQHPQQEAHGLPLSPGARTLLPAQAAAKAAVDAPCRRRDSAVPAVALELDLLTAHGVADGALAAADDRTADADHLGGHDLDAHNRPLFVQHHDERLRGLAGVAARWVEPRGGFALDLQFLPADRHRDRDLLLDPAAADPQPLGGAPYRVRDQFLLGTGHRLISIVIHARVLPASLV